MCYCPQHISHSYSNKMDIRIRWKSSIFIYELFHFDASLWGPFRCLFSSWWDETRKECTFESLSIVLGEAINRLKYRPVLIFWPDTKIAHTNNQYDWHDIDIADTTRRKSRYCQFWYQKPTSNTETDTWTSNYSMNKNLWREI